MTAMNGASPPTPSRAGSIAIALHWVAIALVVAAYATIELEDAFSRGGPNRDAMAGAHYVIGMTVFVLIWVRLAFRLMGGAPVYDPPLARWQAMLATLVEWALYAFMAFMPVLGWAILSANGTPMAVLGLELPALFSADPVLAEKLEDLHEETAEVGLVLVGIHAAAALFHHYVMRNRRGDPGRTTRSPALDNMQPRH
jgi:cytochrome b561